MNPLAVLLSLLVFLPGGLMAQQQDRGQKETTASSGIDMYPMESAERQREFYELLNELRCPKCQNQNIADSDAPIASDMREEVYRMMQEGADEDEVVNALVARFGEFVRYKPTFDRRTALLWLLPAIVVLVGLIVVIVIVRRSQRDDDFGPAALSDDERRKADDLLRRESS
ncbi:cytochrome c-type biogenesis protein CcmH [Marinobacter daqiaonensis]|uniref:Cytochrome c-type biogenesis protein n=1 Tax=Marinobacter daqiaonensis TaxID=650891 RepID=A0A1I6H5L0_9GAMM|nr:cytochrome c-type biogenesis protein [Marinobacter daqiaonensis]SFR49715.1 cytochrome c-type biogenesis protein CcmH [Marinobacter daqiaonensis]